MPAVTAYHSMQRSMQRRLVSGVGNVSWITPAGRFPPDTRRIAAHKSLFKRRHWLGDTLCTLSTAMGLIRLLDDQRELLPSI